MHKTSLRLIAPIALSFSLGLVACSPQSLNHTSGLDPAHPPKSHSVASPVATAQSVSFTYTPPHSFKTQVVSANDVKFIKLTLVGDGVDGTLSNEGGFIPATGETATASILNVPIQPGKVRVVTVQGYDANQQALPAFVGKGYYVSRSGQAAITIPISRRQLLVGLTLEKLLQGLTTGQASQVNLGQLQTAVDQATGFDAITNHFITDPTLFDPQKLADQLMAGETPSLSLILNHATATAGNVLLNVTTPGGGKFTEALSVAVNDPTSTVATIFMNATSPQQPMLSVAPGSWTLIIKKADGTVVGTTSVTVAPNGQVTLGNANFEVSLKPEVASLTPSILNVLGGATVTLTGTGFTGVSAVKFGDSNATDFTVNSDTQISATAPAGTVGNTNVTVSTPGGISAAAAGNQVSYATGPNITGLSASSGTIGSDITITGTHFNATHGNNVVKFGNVIATTTGGNASSLTVNVPAGVSEAVDVRVTDGALTSANTAADNFAVLPTVSGLSALGGSPAGGGTLTLTGAGFASGATTVKFGTTDATNVTVTSNTSLTATIPAGTTGQVDVTAVTTAGGTSATSANSKYLYGPLTPKISGTTQDLYAVDIYAARYVALGNSGTIRVLNSGQTNWFQASTGNPSNTSNFRDVFMGTRQLAVGSGGAILTGSNSSSWTVFSTATTQDLEGVFITNDLIIVVGANGTILTSPTTGPDFTGRTSGVTATLKAITFGNNLFVTVSAAGDILTSPDGITWTSRTNPGGTFLDITFGNNLFVAVGGSGQIVTSPDGITWTERTSNTSNGIEAVAFGNNKFVAVGDSGTLLTSADGITWTVEPTGVTTGLKSVFHDGTEFMVVGNSGSLFTSNGL